MTTPMEHITRAIEVLDDLLSRPDLSTEAKLEIRQAELELLILTGPFGDRPVRTTGGSNDDGMRIAWAALREARRTAESADVAVVAALAERRLAGLIALDEST